jgi:group II intron reverse transcriptase/maturase
MLKFEQKLENLYILNQKDINKVNDNLIKIVADPELLLHAYGNIQGNKGSLTPGVDLKDTVDGFNRPLVNKISKQIKEGIYKWKDIKQIMIPKPEKKKKRPIGIPTFTDKLVQEAIRIVLTTIYEPVFQSIESNHGFRPKRSTHSALDRILASSQGMEYALEGDVTSAYNSVNHKKLLEILKKKISDKKLFRLIEIGLKTNIRFEKKTITNIIGTPQGAIVSPILFNIYMHEFDLEIEKIKKELDDRNKKEKRNKNTIMRHANTIAVRLNRRTNRLDRMKKEKQFNIQKFRRLLKQIEKDKKLQLTLPNKNRAKRLLRISYCRYADDWILLTNLKETEVEVLKKRLTEWLRNELKFELDQEKTYTTNLRKGKAKFLGFTLFIHKKNISSVKNKDGRIFRRRSNERLFTGIDHDRVKSRMIGLQIIDEKYKPRHVGLYCSLKPWEIVTKFSQKLTGFLDYYYNYLIYPSDLGAYYYILRYACLKTLAYRMKISVSKIHKVYGEKMNMKKTIRMIDSKTNTHTIKEGYVKFPRYLEAMDAVGDRFALDLKSKKENKEEKGTITIKNLTEKINTTPMDPLETIKLRANVRTGSKTDGLCCVCSAENSPNNLIEIHHIKHIYKGKIIGFSLIMKSLHRKRIPCCRQCHIKIHKKLYDGIALRDLHNPEVAY